MKSISRIPKFQFAENAILISRYYFLQTRSAQRLSCVDNPFTNFRSHVFLSFHSTFELMSRIEMTLFLTDSTSS